MYEYIKEKIQSLRDPLTIINNSIYYLKIKKKELSAIEDKHFSLIEREIERSSKIIHNLIKELISTKEKDDLIIKKDDFESTKST
ncbi:MAG: hypothetical protein ACTSVI_03815 [Promethearchaeota archaeon]